MRYFTRPGIIDQERTDIFEEGSFGPIGSAQRSILDPERFEIHWNYRLGLGPMGELQGDRLGYTIDED